VVSVFFTFVRDVLGDLKKNISTTETSAVRLALWIYDPVDDVLRFSFSNEITDEATTSRTFGPREGFLGTAFAEKRSWNEAKATELPSFVWIRRDVPYKAIAAAPVTFFDRPLGVLTADKSEDAPFGETAANLIEAAARMIAVALDEYLRSLDRLEGTDTTPTEKAK
jgi:signal transduction protein with GAF and PtsI domain